jgi:broad specificity phosphatase PhoE
MRPSVFSQLHQDEIYQFVFLRHAESTGNASGTWQGQTDYPLTPLGQAQAAALAMRWAGESVQFDEAVSSPLERAYQTARIICDQLHLPIEQNPVWMERDFGALSGLKDSEAFARLPENPFFHPYLPVGENGESQWDLYLRAGQAVQDLMQKPPGRYLVVSHGGILNMVLYALLNIPVQANFQGPRFDFGNTGFATLAYSPPRHRWRLMGLNDLQHLAHQDLHP